MLIIVVMSLLKFYSRDVLVVVDLWRRVVQKFSLGDRVTGE